MPQDEDISLRHEPSPSAPQCLTPKDQIEVILAEYAYRQEEKNAVAGSAMSNLTVVIAVLAGLLALIYQVGTAQWWLVVPAFILVFLAVETDRQFSVLYSSIYIGLLEKRVNKIAGKELLLWEHRGSSYHNYIGKFVVKHPSKNRRVVNISAFMLVIYVLVAMSVFVLGLIESGKWLALNLSCSRGGSAAVIVGYEVAHLCFLGLILFNRFVQHGKVLRLLEEKLRDELFQG